MSLNEGNNELIYFLWSDHEQNIMTNNNLSVHIESGNIFCQNFNTNKNFCSFLLAQQDKTKAIIRKRIAYHYSFQKYVKNFLPSFFVDDVKNFDLCANRNSKYLLYKLKDWTESLQGVEKLIIRHTGKAKDSVNLKIIAGRDRQFLIDKIIYEVEFSNPYGNSIE